jgi:hypothetical protein
MREPVSSIISLISGKNTEKFGDRSGPRKKEEFDQFDAQTQGFAGNSLLDATANSKPRAGNVELSIRERKFGTSKECQPLGRPTRC